MNRLPLALLVATLVHAPTATHAATAIWIGPENGSWSDPANWSTGVVPGNMDIALVDDDSETASVVLANESGYVNTLRVDEGDRLVVQSVGAFRTASFELGGTVHIAPGSVFDPGSSFIIEPSGSILLAPGDVAHLIANSGISTLWWNQGSISGAGEVRPIGSFLNSGSLSANVPDSLLDVYQYSASSTTLLVNNGVARATDGGHLRFKNTTSQYPFIQQSPTARIEASPLSKVTLDRIQLEGGTLAALSDETGNGTVDTTFSTFSHVNFEGTINASRSTLSGRIHNTGKFQVLLSASVADVPVKLSGGGIFQLADPITQSVLTHVLSLGDSDRRGIVMFENLDNTIRGSGDISLSGGTLVNRGVIESGYGSTEPPPIGGYRSLGIQGGFLTNAGILRSTSKRKMTLWNVTATNSIGDQPGVIEAQPGGTIELSGTSIRGGILRAVAAPDGSMLLDGVVQPMNQATRLTDLRLEGNIGSNTARLTLNGRIEIDGSLRLTELYLAKNTEIVGGEVLIGDNPGRIWSENNGSTSDPATLLLTDTTLRLGTVWTFADNLRVTNNGTIVASANAVANFRAGNPLVNSGLIHAEAGAELRLPAIETPRDATNAQLSADTGARIYTSRLSGGEVVPAPGGGIGLVGISGNSSSYEPSLENITNRGYIQVLSGSIGGWITNHGIVELGSNDVDQVGQFLEFTGDGELRLNGRSLRQPIGVKSVTLANGPGHTIRTHGTLAFSSSAVINEGIIQADTGTMTIQVGSGGSFVQKGTLRTVGANTLNVYTSGLSFHNYGNFDVGVAGTLNFFAGSRQIGNRAGSGILVDGTLSTSLANLVNDTGATIRGGGIITGTGDTTINQSILTNHGLVAPGSSIGDLQIRGNYIQSATGVLEIDVAGFETGEFDQLIIETISASSGGLATLAGTLDFNFAPEVLPALGDELVVLTAKQITGTFDTIEGLPTLAAGLDWQIDYLPTMVMATVIGLTPPTLAGDFNGDGFVNLADYTVWRDGLGDSFAASDYDLWKQNFGRSANDPAPEATAPATVPEPTTALLAILAFVPLLARRAIR